MAVIESLVAKSAENELKALNANLEQTRKTIIEISKTQLDFNGGSSVSSLADFNTKMKESIYLRQKSEAQAERMRLSEIRLQQAREKAFDNYDKSLTKEQQGLARAESAYNRIQASVTLLTKTYQDLAIRKQLGSELTIKEEAQLLSLTKRLNMYQTALSKVDQNIQKYGRNVGNYASGFNPLSNAIGQITRELPNFAQSVQIGILSLTNNIGALQDSIQQIIAQNKLLRAEGKSVTSVFSQIGASILSFNTLLYIGIAALSAYGKEIGDALSNLFRRSNALDAVAEAQKSVNESSIAGRKNAQQELIALRGNLAVAKDVTLSYKERVIAVDNIQKQYPFYFENLTKEQILAGQTTKAENALTEAILSRAKAQAAVSRITENQSKIIDLEEKRLQILNDTAKAEANIRAVQSRSYAASNAENQAQSEAESIGRLQNLRRELIKTDKEIADITTINNRLSTYAIQNQKESIGLDYQKDKSKEKVIKRKKEEAILDGLASKGSDSIIASLEEQIRKVEELRYAVSKNGVEYKEYTKIIEALRIQLRILTDFDALMAENVKKASDELIAHGENIKAVRAEYKMLEDATESFIGSFSNSFLSDSGLGSLDKFFDGTFNRLMEGANTLDEKFKVTFLSISESAQEAFNFINQASEQRFEAQLDRLQREKDIALQFAGESASAREEIERQYDERQREIKRRQAEQNKQNAIFNILINTAQAVVAALPNIPLSVAIGAIGAIQAGIVAAQRIPEFWKGTDNAPEGWALVDEKRPEVHTDAKGNIKSLGSEKGANYRYLNKGDKIYKSRDEYFSKELHNIMKDNGISFHNEMAKSGLLNYTPRQDKGITAAELESVIRRTQPKQSSGSEFRIKKTDVKQFWTDMLAETENKNNRYSGRGRKV